ncbi:hypothetical protein [Mycobacterium sp. ZZG]
MPTNSTDRRREVAPAIGRATERGADKARGTKPSLGHLLSRAAVTLAEQVPSRDAHDSYDEPWPDVPEELEPVDDDAVDDEDFDVGGTYTQRPMIVYSRAAPWVPPASARSAESDGIDGDLRFTVRSPQDGLRNHDPATVAIIVDEIHRIAAALERLQPRALAARTRIEAVRKMMPMQQKELAAEFGDPKTTSPLLSRRRREIIQAPWGLVPLEYFWWFKDDGLSVVEARDLITELRTDADRPALAIARVVAERHSLPGVVATRADAIRHQVPQMRALLPFVPMLNILSQKVIQAERENLEKMVDEEVLQQTGLKLNKRGAGLVRLGLAGAFEELDLGA